MLHIVPASVAVEPMDPVEKIGRELKVLWKRQEEIQTQASEAGSRGDHATRQEAEAQDAAIDLRINHLGDAASFHRASSLAGALVQVCLIEDDANALGENFRHVTSKEWKGSAAERAKLHHQAVQLGQRVERMLYSVAGVLRRVVPEPSSLPVDTYLPEHYGFHARLQAVLNPAAEPPLVIPAATSTQIDMPPLEVPDDLSALSLTQIIAIYRSCDALADSVFQASRRDQFVKERFGLDVVDLNVAGEFLENVGSRLSAMAVACADEIGCRQPEGIHEARVRAELLILRAVEERDWSKAQNELDLLRGERVTPLPMAAE